MKPEEKIAKSFLVRHYRTEPIYEPLGRGSPPDFRINNTAFEVRRLNQNYISKHGSHEGLEQVEYPLIRAVYKELGRIRFSPQTGSYFVLLSYRRPLGSTPRLVADALAKKASAHYAAGLKNRVTIGAFGVTAELVPAGKPRGEAFLSGTEEDDDSGGWVGEIYLRNIEIALKDKIAKTKPIVARFDKWALVLVDSILPEISWAKEVQAPDLDLQHFSTIAILNRNGALVWEWPEDSLKALPI